MGIDYKKFQLTFTIPHLTIFTIKLFCFHHKVKLTRSSYSRTISERSVELHVVRKSTVVLIFFPISIIKMENSKGYKIEPCGTSQMEQKSDSNYPILFAKNVVLGAKIHERK